MKIDPKFLVLKIEDIRKLSAHDLVIFERLLDAIQRRRIEDGKLQTNQYIVVNTDEDYVDDIVEVLAANGHWDDAEGGTGA